MHRSKNRRKPLESTCRIGVASLRGSAQSNDVNAVNPSLMYENSFVAAKLANTDDINNLQKTAVIDLNPTEDIRKPKAMQISY